MGAMTIARAPVREPAWSLSRSAIGLWVTEGVIGSVFAGIGAAAVVLFVPSSVGFLRWLVPAVALVYAVAVIGVRPWVRFRVHRWEVTGEAVLTLTGWLTRTWTLVPISRRRHPRRAAAAVRAVDGGGTDRVLAGHRARLAPGGRRRPAGRRRPGPPRRTGPRPGHMTQPPSPGRRTSPRVVLVHTITFRQARQFVPAVIPLVAAVGLDGGAPTIVGLVLGVTVLSLATAGLSWWRFSYVDGPSSVVVTRGLLSRSVRMVPNDRIRGVEVETPVLHRLFGLVRVRIDAAAGGVTDKGEELVVDGLPRSEGDRLRTAVLTHRSSTSATADGVPVAMPAEEEFARFDNRWLLYAPLVGSYLAVPLAAVGALFRLAQELPESVRPEFDEPDLSGLQVLAITAAAGLLLLGVGSVIGAAVVNWGFRLVRRGGSLVATRGLITRRHTELEIDRIRGCTVAEGAGMRLVGATRVNALVTGLGDAARRGQLLPLGPREEAWALA